MDKGTHCLCVCRYGSFQRALSQAQCSTVSMRHQCPEMHESRRQTQRSRQCGIHASPSHVFRNAGQLFVWQILQSRSHQLCMEVFAGRAEVTHQSTSGHVRSALP